MIKGVIFYSVLLTWIGCYLDGSAPYFPIEISRTATGHLSYWPFAAGGIISLYWVNDFGDAIAWLGYGLLTIVDDKSNWGFHMLGVGIMISGLLFKIRHDPVKLVFAVSIGGLFVARILAKIMVVWAAELDFAMSLSAVTGEMRRIMLEGTCKKPELTLTVMKITGVMQWLCFWALSSLL